MISESHEEKIYYSDIEEGTAKQEKSYKHLFIMISGGVFTAFATVMIIFGLIWYFNIEYVKVYGDSMSPTFTNADGVFLSTREEEPERNDIVVFTSPEEWLSRIDVDHLTEDNEDVRHLIKRIIAQPGDEIMLSPESIHVNNENILTNNSEDFMRCLNNKNIQYTLQEDEYFVMGDNYPYSTDAYALYCKGLEMDEILVSKDSFMFYGENSWRIPGGVPWF